MQDINQDTERFSDLEKYTQNGILSGMSLLRGDTQELMEQEYAEDYRQFIDRVLEQIERDYDERYQPCVSP